MKKLIKLLFAIIALLVVVALFNLNTIKRVYKAIHFFDEDVIIDNFRNADANYPVNRLTPASQPYVIEQADTSFTLPAHFNFKNEQINTQAFLEQNRLEGIMIIKDDKVVLEEYKLGFTPDDTHIGWSLSKSVVSALLGIAYHDGLFELDAPITQYLPQFKGTGYDNVKIKNLLQMSSGVGFNEDYGDFHSDINRFGRTFAFGKSFEDFALTLKNEKPQGTYNQYVSIDTQVLGMLLTKVTGMGLTEYYQQKLWEPLGMQDHGEWIIDETGMEMALGGLNMTMRDYAKIGLLYLHQGKLNGQQLIPSEWVKMSTTPDAPHLMPGKRDNATREQGYGFQWWIPVHDDGDFFGSGIYDQYIYVQPHKNLVIVTLSANHHFKTRKRGGERKHVALFKAIADTL
ncbi:serine hydrolase [Psychrobacter sp. HD31]|uniref:serine hydrolase domain-containing protein n=1 Tax=Psychrobacter sp. HD31 TaxID=3112003 RepID=UPI003DA2516C